jgi:ABC-2 type transport system ATP-binding protein
VLRAEGVVKRYAAREVLRSVTLAAGAGEILGFVGPNGAGKTTFLKCIAGVARPDAGVIHIGAADALRDPLAARRQIAYAPSDTAMYDSLSVDAMLRFQIAFHPHADLARGRALIERFELPPRARVRALSHGMKRKLLLAGALACNAPLLLLDEPMEGLDPEARRTVEGLLLEQAAQGRTVFFSSHDLGSVERICARVAFLRAGTLMEIAPINVVLERAGRILLLRLRQPLGASALPAAPSLRWSAVQPDADGCSDRWHLSFEGELAAVLPQLAGLPLAGLRDASGGLEEVFAVLYGPATPEEARP